MEHPTEPFRGRAGLSQRFFAWLHNTGESPEYERAIETHKRSLFADLHGAVLEIGAGGGANFAYFPKTIRWIGVEPNVFMHPYLQKAAAEHGFAADIRTVTAERIAVEDASVDAVVSTLVLCSVDDPSGVLREVLRVLKPGGRFVFIEHVAAPSGTFLHKAQKAITPIWKLAADGCHPDRDTETTIERAGFSRLNVTHFRAPVPIASPHLAGVAVK